MFLIDVAIVGGALYTAAKACRPHRKKGRLAACLQPATQAEKPADIPQPVVNGPQEMVQEFRAGNLTPVLNEVDFEEIKDRSLATFDAAHAALMKLEVGRFIPFVTPGAYLKNGVPAAGVSQRAIKPLWGGTRQQQLNEIESGADQYQVHSLNGKNDRKVSISALSLGLATVGALVYPPLSLLSLPGIFYASASVFKSAYRAIAKERKTNIDIPVAIILTVSVATGHLWIASFQVFLAMYNRKLMAKIKGDSKAQVVDVFRQQPNHVWVLYGQSEIKVPFEAVAAGDIVVVQAGGIIPVDGHIVAGIASVDQHMLTGESQPVEKGPGDPVHAATVVLSGTIQIKVEKAGQETTAAQIGKVLNNTINFKTGMQMKIEEVGDRAVGPILLASGLSVPLLGPIGAIAFLNSHPKYKTTIATYIGILRFLEQASRKGVLVKDGRVFELLNGVDTVVFDKTGTLTHKQPHVGRIYTCGPYQENEVLTYAAAAEARQSHPIALAILHEAKTRQLKLPPLDEAEYKLGYGLAVTINNRLIRVGSQRFIQMEGIGLPPHINRRQEACHLEGHSLILVTVDSEVAGAIELHATLRPEAETIIAGLRQRNIKATYIISGDHQRATHALADRLDIDHYFAETLPEQKADLIEQLQQAGRSVCYIGDGINDAIALRKADVSISLRGASTVATDTAQIILMDESLRQLCYLFDLAQEFDATMKRTAGLVLLPHLIAAGGVLFGGWGLLASIIINQTGLVLGVGSSMLPGKGMSEHQPLLPPVAGQTQEEQH